MCSLDLEPCAIWDEEPRTMSTATYKGRPHECDGCGAVIARGEPYLRHSSLFDGSWSGEKMCVACWWTREVFGDAHDGMKCQPGAIREQLQECIGENDDPLDEWRPHLAALKGRYRASPQWRRQLQQRWAERREHYRRIVLARDGFGAPA